LELYRPALPVTRIALLYFYKVVASCFVYCCKFGSILLEQCVAAILFSIVNVNKEDEVGGTCSPNVGKEKYV
jgi:hypothetical protein